MHQVSGYCLKPNGFSSYEKVDCTLSLPENTAILLNTNTPMVVPFANGNSVGVIVPVKTILREVENGVVRHRFYGYYVVFEGSVAKRVLDAGIYERVFAESDKDVELGLPAVIVKRFDELSKAELRELAGATPPQLVPALDRSEQHWLVSSVIAELLRRDPLRVAELPDYIIKKYVLDSDDPIIKTALLENTPAMIKVLETQLKSRGIVEGDKLSLIYYRYWEEELEDKELEKISKRRVHRHGELSSRLAALGATVPLTVSMVSLPVLASRIRRRVEHEEKAKALSAS